MIQQLSLFFQQSIISLQHPFAMVTAFSYREIIKAHQELITIRCKQSTAATASLKQRSRLIQYFQSVNLMQFAMATAFSYREIIKPLLEFITILFHLLMAAIALLQPLFL